MRHFSVVIFVEICSDPSSGEAEERADGDQSDGGGAKYKGTQMREEKLAEMIEKKVKEARQVCEGDARSDECKVAWDEVEEVSQAKADLRIKLNRDQDPLTSFCEENPETDECRIYED
ncbi:hypothetical protein RJ639_014467 [Escallonia herrerae]|uniref:CP12 domain-containing protein n=1 Tax=Escallonia herrerae TaxID=1293975 RepID=A0AA88VI08_9ASTE|nr:hypothetical protein RJ639_014467 [Escallonia herrerae]